MAQCKYLSQNFWWILGKSFSGFFAKARLLLLWDKKGEEQAVA